MTTTCSEEGCTDEARGRGLCSKHYQRFRYQGTLDQVRPHATRCLICDAPLDDPEYRKIYCSQRCNELARGQRRRAIATRRFERCLFCDLSLDGKRLDARFCSERCGDGWRNRQRQERLDVIKVATRQPCRGCGGKIPDALKSTAMYCSDDCKIKSRRHEAYGLTKDDLDALLEQHGVCAICGSDRWGRKGPQVDHDHVTGRVRGVLCLPCNAALGLMKDDPDRLRAAINYLEAHAS